MRVLCLQHSRLGGHIHLPDWAVARGHAWRSIIVPETPELPDLRALDCLVVMGGPMSAWDDHKYAWLGAEKRLIESMISAGRPVLGICLGAQLVASVLGARTYRGHRPEIGWFRVEATPEAPRHPVGRCLPQAFETFLWHEDSFDLPAGGVRIARSASYPQQAFCYGSALALQFHLEARRDWVGRIASRDGHRLVPGPSVQSVERIVSAPASLYAANNGLMDRLLDAWLASVAVAAR